MTRLVAIALCLFLCILTVQVYAQGSASGDKSTDPVFIAGIELVVVLGVLYFLLPKNAKDDSTDRRNSYVGLMIFGFILLAMMTTNPSLEDHRQAVMNEVENKINKHQADAPSDGLDQVGASIGETIGKFVLDRVVERENYLLFSVTIVKVENSKRDIGVGIFGKVWLYDNLN